MTHPPTAASLRRHLRGTCIAAREAVPEARRAAWTTLIEDHLDTLVGRLAPTCLAFCWPHRGEPDLRGWVDRWLAGDSNRRAAIPVVTEQARPMAFRRWTPAMAMAMDRHGIPIPPPGPEAHPEILLIPVNAFDDAGYRLGYGGGYFDRTLDALDTMPVKIGVGFELSHVATTHPQAHDHPMDWIVTETGLRHPGALPRGE